jgi:hypothetical protein
MRLEVVSAFVVGILLPALETVRRGLGHWTVNFTTMLEDYVAGGLLLVGAFACTRSKSYAPRLLLVGWAYVTGMMGSSFWDQLESTIRGVDLEPNNSAVLAFKLILWATCLISLVSSYVHALAERGRRGA